MIQFKNVSKVYGNGSCALSNVSFTIHNGEFVFIVGASGSGKSTLIKLLLKEIEPTKGKVFVNNKDLRRLRHGQVAKYRRCLGVVFQNFRLLPDRNVYENVAFAQRVIDTPLSVIRRRVPTVLASMGLAEKFDSYPAEISGGEQQRVALARALVNNPLILLADEPTGNIDPKQSIEIMELLDDINKRGTTVIVVTHNREIVDIMQKRVITLHDGKLISDEQKGGYSNEF
ncbi:MAG TPA: cell division ATP-binding protein FtsE [Clostridiales bacterium]|nr:cell division ATP-binding protein FtsE [Clostridiales bacterium]